MEKQLSSLKVRLTSYIMVIVVMATLSACTSVNVPVSPQFGAQATKMPVSGINGWTINQKLNFGPYQTSPVKRGWDFSASLQHTKFGMRPEETLLMVFNIDTDKKSDYQRNRFQYTLENGGQVAEIYATEKFTEKQLVYKSNNPFIGSISNTKNYKYSFTAAIVPLAPQAREPWSLVLLSTYERGKDTARNILDEPYVEEEGYATNGKETIAISPIRLENVGTKTGASKKVIGGKLFSGYELRIDNNMVGMIDMLDNNVWINKELEEQTKFMLASISSAILLKRIHEAKDHDVE